MRKSIIQRAREAHTREELGSIILDLLAARQPRRAVEIAQAVGRGRVAALRALVALESAGKALRIGRGPATRWERTP